MSAPTELRLQEWSNAHPDTCLALRGLTLPAELRSFVTAVNASGRLEILELARGLQISTRSWVGRLQLGDLTLIITPKIDAIPLTALLRYVYGLRDLELKGKALQGAASDGLQDILVLQLIEETRDLMVRGLHRDYERRSDDLAVPRGRLAFARLPATYGRARAVLPCDYHPRTLDNRLNRALVGALLLAARVAKSSDLRLDAASLANLLANDIVAAELTWAELDAADAKLDRRTVAYAPSLRLARLLLEGAGLALDDGQSRIELPGFLFDMNLFFQALVTKFLGEHLEDLRVLSEQPLCDMYLWDPQRNPNKWRPPRPRPDILIMDGNDVRAVLDAKYKDLWGLRLPEDMLYQLTLYALGHKTKSDDPPTAIIIYPTTTAGIQEQAVFLHDPWSGETRATVMLRGCDLVAMASVLGDPDPSNAATSRALLARRMVFG